MRLPDLRKNLQSADGRGYTLVEVLVAVAILGILFGAISTILHQILQNVGESRVRAVALSLAQDKMEIVRNLPYNQVGTSGGIPQGPILPTETISLNSQHFSVTTSVIYIDDPFDGVAPTDLLNTDYKRARVEVTWGGVYPSRKPVTLVTNIAPKGLETAAGGGTLFIRVFNAGGQPVPSATVNIDNTVVIPNIHTQTFTDNSGLVVLPGSPACLTCYRIAITKAGYSSDKTYTTTEVANPLQPYATVIEGEVSQLSFGVDLTATVSITSYGSRESGYPLITSVPFTLRGTKIIGYDVNDDPVYKYSFVTSTGSSGTVNTSGLEWDSYVLDFTNSTYLLAGANPVSPAAVPPATNVPIIMSAVPKTPTSLLLTVKNPAGETQASASVHLASLPSFDETKGTGATGSADFGQAFFGGLDFGTYDLVISLSGYEEATASLTLSTNHEQTFTLNPAP